jgi:hypothetical protein
MREPERLKRTDYYATDCRISQRLRFLDGFRFRPSGQSTSFVFIALERDDYFLFRDLIPGREFIGQLTRRLGTLNQLTKNCSTPAHWAS